MSDLEVLFPEQEIEIKGEKVTVNELTFAQTMKLGGELSPLIASLSNCLDEDEMDGNSAISAFYEHENVSYKMLEMSTGKDREYFESLSDSDGYTLLLIFFTVHSNFFGRRLLTAATQKQQIKETLKAVG